MLEARWGQDQLPFVRHLQKDLYELKTKVAVRYPRIIYFLYGKNDENSIVYLHGFLKKQGKTPNKEIKIALARRDDHRKQFGG